jgi:hypothetical protein
VVKALSTAVEDFLVFAVRTRAPDPAGARRWVTRIAPEGATTSMVGVLRRCRTSSVVPVGPGGTE